MLKPGAHVKTVADSSGAILIDLREGKYFSLNAVGLAMWSALAADTPPTELVARLSEMHSVPEARVLADVNTFYDTLLERGLVDGAR